MSDESRSVWRLPRATRRGGDPPQLNGTGAQLVDEFTTIKIEKERPDWRFTGTTDYLWSSMTILLR
ncbi:MAG: hypothetical protein ABI664_05610 [bacterium]